MHKTFVRARLAVLILGTTLLASGKAAADFVIPDDLIVQGSACVGFDCVDGEAFGFDTIRLKENNLRIMFMDTSVAPFPTNDWQLTANDSASGGASKFSIDDVTGSKTPFTIIAAAPTNSMFVASSGKVGFRTSTPALDLHVATSDTPAHRFEQTNAGGFTAQTWDVAGNEANFFVRDVTGGSRLPFRIRPGAPTSSIDISSNGNVGVGTASPGVKLHVISATADDANGVAQIFNSTNATGPTANSQLLVKNVNGFSQFMQFENKGLRIGTRSVTAGNGDVFFTRGNDTVAMTVLGLNGNIGVGTSVPAAQFHTTGSVRLAGITGCGGGIQSNGSGDLSCIVSSRQFKNIAGDLPTNVALANVMALRPQTGSYKETPDVPEHWLIAEDVAAVDPALIGLNDGRPHVVKTQNIVADLVAVVQQQQRQIEELRRLVAAK